MPRHFMTMVALAALCLAGCQGANLTNGPNESFDPNARFPASVEPQMMTLRLPYTGGSLDLNESAQIERFAADYLDHGSGAIAVSAPNRFRDAPNAFAERLVELGVPQERILIGNQDESGANDTVKLTYIRYVASTPRCGDWSTDLAFTLDNKVPSNFGCATQHNVAAAVADPRDLVSPRPTTPDDAQRRLQVLDKYRKGETTVAQKTQAQSGTVSQVSAGM
jgi:pilus assembly protein CpaD